ncbi:conserved protein of unknown function [Rhodovastum atsumiense]|uniref:Uncharacterized protein n=1 Tax=Rhodovastum atsumiense TaxID=504468 RepID=A0A5M6IL80_9PROT|nr:hypothetical protein [Rhodovastum atsumiense]KAA5608994.1 hypothetical protein F1189_26295 [Rhodovastum atsumiense]CAH2599091.1 conserved protein of unknown function [Rhodovastum atsumiense]
MDFGLSPVLDFTVRMILTVFLLYALYCWLDFLYRGNNRYPKIFGALERGISFILSAPFGGAKSLDVLSRRSSEPRRDVWRKPEA